MLVYQRVVYLKVCLVLRYICIYIYLYHLISNFDIFFGFSFLKHYFGGQNTGVPGCSSDAPTADPLPRIYRNVLFQMPLQSYGPTFYPQPQNHRGNPNMEKTWENCRFRFPKCRNQPSVSGDQPWLKSMRKALGSAWNCTINFGEVKIRLFTSCDRSKDGWMIYWNGNCTNPLQSASLINTPMAPPPTLGWLLLQTLAWHAMSVGKHFTSSKISCA